MEMTPKQRLLAAIKSEPVDHVPFSPFLAYYFDYLPKEIQDRGMFDYYVNMGADPLFRGGATAFKTNPVDCEIKETIEGLKKTVIYSQPKGNLRFEYTYVPDAKTWFITKHPVSTVEDIALLTEYFKKVEVVSNHEIANERVRMIGEQGLHLAILGIGMKSAFQNLIENWVGTENLVYLCSDYPDEIEELVHTMKRKNLETVALTAASEVSGCISWEDSSTTNISPSMYLQYIVPEITEWCKLLRQADKVYVQHACGHIKDLLLPMANQGVHGIESLTPFPTGNVTPELANEMLPKHISIIGGIDPVRFLEDSTEKLLADTAQLLDLYKGRGFILSNSDSCPPGVSYEKFVKIAELVKSHH